MLSHPAASPVPNRTGKFFARRGVALLPRRIPLRPAATEGGAFLGLGHRSPIREPERFRAHLAEATGKVRALRKQLGTRRAAREALGAREP